MRVEKHQGLPDCLKTIRIFALLLGVAISTFSGVVRAEPAAPASATNPVLIEPADLKKYIQALGGTIDVGQKTATLNGFIHKSCQSLLRLDATGVPTAQGRIVFGMYDLGGGLDCLKKTFDTCKDHSACDDFAAIDGKTKKRLKRPFKSWVPLENKPGKDMKIALANSGHLSQTDTDHRKLEASGGCDCDVNLQLNAEPVSGKQTKAFKDIADKIGKDTGIKPKPIPDDEDDDSGNEPDQPVIPNLPIQRHARTPPGLRHVPSDAEMAMQVQTDMYPFYQGLASSSAYSGAMASMINQQTQGELNTIQQYRPNNYTLGTFAYPGMTDWTANYAQQVQAQSLLLATPVNPYAVMPTGPSPNSVLMYQSGQSPAVQYPTGQ